MKKTPALSGMPKSGSAKPHIRMRKVKPVPPSAFPSGPAAFPADPGAPTPGGALAASPGGMPSGAAGGDMGE